MSFGQFSMPPPADQRHCPECGEMMPAAADTCWLCLKKFVTEDAPPRVADPSCAGASTAIQE